MAPWPRQALYDLVKILSFPWPIRCQKNFHETEALRLRGETWL
jgi:hypothetical protein